MKQKGISHFTAVKILKTFNADELNEFGKFVKSPFYNNYSNVIKLFDELKNYYPEFSNAGTSKENLFSAVCNGKSYDDKLFRKYMSLLSKLAEEYLNVLELRAQKVTSDLNILEQLSGRNLNDIYSRKLKGVEDYFESSGKLDSGDFLKMHHLSSIKFNHKSSYRSTGSHSRELIGSHNNLLNYFAFTSSSIVNQLEVYKHSFSLNDEVGELLFTMNQKALQNCIRKLKANTSSESKRTALFYEMIFYDRQLNSSKTGFTAYKKLKKLLFNDIEKFNPTMLYHYFQRLNTFCILENVKGLRDMNKELFENYLTMLHNGLFFIQGTRVIDLPDFRAILRTAIKNKAYEWIEGFIKKYLDHVTGDTKENLFYYAKAMLSFYKNEHSDSLEYISKIVSAPQPFQIDIYILKAKIFYVLGHYDSALSVTDSFRHFITANSDFSDYHKQTIMNFLKHFNSMVRISRNKNVNKAQRLLEELELSTNTRERKWMIEMTNAMIANESA